MGNLNAGFPVSRHDVLVGTVHVPLRVLNRRLLQFVRLNVYIAFQETLIGSEILVRQINNPQFGVAEINQPITLTTCRIHPENQLAAQRVQSFIHQWSGKLIVSENADHATRAQNHTGRDSRALQRRSTDFERPATPNAEVAGYLMAGSRPRCIIVVGTGKGSVHPQYTAVGNTDWSRIVIQVQILQIHPSATVDAQHIEFRYAGRCFPLGIDVHITTGHFQSCAEFFFILITRRFCLQRT